MSNQQRQGGFQNNQSYQDSAAYQSKEQYGNGLQNQSKKQYKQELAQQIEQAAKMGDSEALENIMDQRGDEVQYLKKEMHKALLQTVLNCSSAKKDSYIECIRLLNWAGANIDAEDSSDGKTALMIACEKGYVELVAELILLEAQVNIKDKKGRTPLFYALEAHGENLDVVMQLLNKGADVNIVSVDGWSPLLKATQKQYNQILKKLLEQGAQLSHKNSNSNTALHIATELADLEALQLLLEHGAGRDLVNQNKDKETPLMIAEKNAMKSNQHKEIYHYLQQVVEEQEEKSKKAKDELVMQEDEERERRKIKNKQRETKYQQYKEEEQEEDEDLQDEGPVKQSENNSPGSHGYLKSKTFQQLLLAPMAVEEDCKVQNSPLKMGEETKSYGGMGQFQQQEWPQSASNKKQQQSNMKNSSGNNLNFNNTKKNNGNNGNQSNLQFNQSTNQQSARGPQQNNLINELAQDLNMSRNNPSYKGQKSNNTQQQVLSPIAQQQQHVPTSNHQAFNASQQQQTHHQQQNLTGEQSRNQNQQKYNKSLPFPTNPHQQQIQQQQQQQQHSPQIHPQPTQGGRYAATPQIAQQQQLPPVMNGVQVNQGITPGMMIIWQPQQQQPKQQVIMNSPPNAMSLFAMPLAQQQMAIMALQQPPNQQQLQQVSQTQNAQPIHQYQQQQQQQNSSRMYQQQPQPVLSHQNSQNTQRNQGLIEETINLSTETDQRIFVLQTKIMHLEGQLAKKDKDLALYKSQAEYYQRHNNENMAKLEQADKDIELRMKQEQQLTQSFQFLQNELNSSRHQLDHQRQQMQSQLEQNKERRIEIEKLLINICTKYKTLVETIIVKNKDKVQFTDSEIETVKKDLNESQEAFNQFLIPESPTVPITYSGGHQFQVINQGAPSAIDDRLIPKQNMLVRMMERFEIQAPQQLDQNEVFRRLSEEILVFRESVRDILAEMQPIKEQLIKNISSVIKRTIINSDVKVYGSHATKLCLPWSDIDLVIIAPKNEMGMSQHPTKVLSMIARELQQEVANSWVKSVNYVENASVPVIKLSCNVDQILYQFPQLGQAMIKYKPFFEQPFNIDITQLTENHNGLECVKLVQEFLAENEVIEPLILVLKQYLKVCNYNDPYFGGISSYALFLMIVSYLQSQQVPKELNKVNLGKLLINFFQFYGDFQHIHYGIYTCMPGKMPEKQNQFSYVNFSSQCVQIEDPLNSHNNVGKSSFKFVEIKESFQFTGQIAFVGCFCECHNEKLHIEKARFDLNTMGLSRVTQKGLRKCDSILSKVIYSYMQYLSQQHM